MYKLVFVCFLFVFFNTTNLLATESVVDRGKELVTTQCFACHGLDGISIIDIYPNLNGQKEKYLVKQLTAFRDGTRIDPVMSPMAIILTDEDIAAVSKYLSELE